MTRPSLPLRIAVWLVNAACAPFCWAIEAYERRLEGRTDDEL